MGNIQKKTLIIKDIITVGVAFEKFKNTLKHMKHDDSSANAVNLK